MKVSINWAQDFSNVDLKSLSTKELLQKIGAQLGAVEEVIEWGPRYEGIYVAKIVSVEKHPNADKLHLCKIDDGGVVDGMERDRDDNIQLVCGAPVIEPGMIVAWLAPGATVPATYNKDPFVLEVREIRGVASPGMLGTPHELGISEDQSGLLLIKAEDVGEDNIKPGTPFKRLFGMDDVVIDCENKMFTHRPDCFGILGVAREIAGISGQSFESPSWYLQSSPFEAESRLPLTVFNDIPELVPRFMAVPIDGIVIKPSPLWMQASLTRVGIRPINNIVDITNFMMQLTGQPMHAFDYDKIKARSGGEAALGARFAKEGEELTLLGGKKLKLSAKDMVLATDKHAADLAGVMGGAETEVDNDTKAIILTCVSFDMYTIRRSTMRHGVFTDASTRYTKGQSPHQNERVLGKTIEMIREFASGVVAGKVIDDLSNVPKMNKVAVTAEFINKRLGTHLLANEMKKLLENVEFIVDVDGDNLIVDHPYWRTDIEIPEDVVEEIGRLYGYDRVPVALPKRDIVPVDRNNNLELKSKIRTLLARAGANELLTYSFVHGKLLEKVGQDPKQAFCLSNALSPDLQYYRLALTPSLLDKVHMNIRADYVRTDDNDFALFEINKVHMKGIKDPEEPTVPQEDSHVALVFASDDKTAARKYSGSPYYQAKKYLEQIIPGVDQKLMLLSEVGLSSDAWAVQLCAPYEPRRAAVIMRGDQVWGVVGEFKENVKKALKLPEYCAGFEVGVESVADVAPHTYEPLSPCPRTQQDITFEMAATDPYRDLDNLVRQHLAETDYRFTLESRDVFQAEDSDKKRITLRIWLSHSDKTLTTDEVNRLLDKVSTQAESNLGAVRQ